MKTNTDFLIRTTLLCLGFLGIATTADAGQCGGSSPWLKIDKHTLDFSEKKPICIEANSSFIIALKPQSGYDLDFTDVTIEPKAGYTGISKGGVAANGDMTVNVGNIAIGEEPKYKIIVAGVGELDPRVRIIPSYRSLNKDLDAIQNTLITEYGLTIPELQKLDRKFTETYDIGIADILELAPNTEQQQQE